MRAVEHNVFQYGQFKTVREYQCVRKEHNTAKSSEKYNKSSVTEQWKRQTLFGVSM